MLILSTLLSSTLDELSHNFCLHKGSELLPLFLGPTSNGLAFQKEILKKNRRDKDRCQVVGKVLWSPQNTSPQLASDEFLVKDLAKGAVNDKDGEG